MPFKLTALRTLVMRVISEKVTITPTGFNFSTNSIDVNFSE